MVPSLSRTSLIIDLMKRVHKFVPAATIALFVVVPQSSSASDVWLDWDGAIVTMGSAWSSAGYGAGSELTPMEVSSVIAMSEGKLAAKFGGYSVTFLGSAGTGAYEWLKFGSTTTSTTTYGVSSGIDWRNTVKDGTVDLYLANFGGILSSSLFTRAENISRLSSAIANTAAHELGHNFGLQHYDAYGIPSITAPGYFFSGEQNGSIMATGVTGLTAPDRGTDRFFNPIEKVKLEYADGIAPSLASTVAEAVGDKSTLATAQTIYGSTLSLSPGTSVNVDAKIDIPGQMDVYKFYAEAGSLISANTLSHGILPSFTDTTLFLMDASGTTLHMSTDIYLSGDSFMTPGMGYYSDDSLFFHYAAPYSGTYYLKVMGTAPGDYDLLVTGLATVPEPGTVAAVSFGVVTFLRRRRKHRS